MSRKQKPEAPKFKPVAIAGMRPEICALAMAETEALEMLKQDNTRIMAEIFLATMDRLKVLQEHLGLSGELGEKDNLLLLLMTVAGKYVPGFEVTVGEKSKRGPKKAANRFKTVTEVEEMKFQRSLPTIVLAIEAIAADRRPTIRPPELQTKYYACSREIEANETTAALLRFWRKCREVTPLADKLQGFDDLFWTYERDYLGAIRQSISIDSPAKLLTT
jgi:hypothetical protein